MRAPTAVFEPEWATFAKILLIAITLFFLGPQLGSLDIDCDGIPDVPLVVTHVNAPLNRHLRQRNVVLVREVLFRRLTPNDSHSFQDDSRLKYEVMTTNQSIPFGAKSHSRRPETPSSSNTTETRFRRVANAPEFYYILGFIPQSMKSDGKYHTIKVTLVSRQKYDLQARRGYYAPRRDVSEAEEAKREIEDEVFSSEELHDLPLALHTEFFKPSDDLAKLTVLAHVDVKRLHYKQSNERHLNDLTLVTAVFDRNGNFLQGDQKLVQMRWKGETLQAKLGSGITLKTSFDVKPGRYLVRVVARDSEQQVMSAENGAVEIP